MRPKSAHALARFCTVVFAVLVVSASSLAPGSEAAAAASDDAARWHGNDLIGPLPVDPTARAAALARVRELNPRRTSNQSFVESVQPTYSRPVASIAVPPRFAADRLTIETNTTNPIPGLLTSFNGIPYNTAAPANPDIAAGPNHVVVTAGDEFGVYDKCGTLQDGGDINTYFPVPSNIQFSNGRIIYDDWDSRWVMSFVGNTFAGASYIYVFVSNTSSPLSGWFFYALAVTLATEYPDDVHIAVDPAAFYFTFDHINLAGGYIADAGIWYVDKTDLYANAAVTTIGFCGMSHLNDFVPALGIRPSQLRSYDGNMYFLGCNIDGGNSLNIRTIQDPWGSPSLLNTVVPVPAYNPPPNGWQTDGTRIESGDARFTDVVYFNGEIFASRIFLSNGEAWTYTELIDASAPAHVTAVASNGAAGAAIDVDESGALTVLRSTHAAAVYPTAAYSIFGMDPFEFFESGTVAGSQGAYQQGGFGNDAVPYQLADYFGAALDPTDRRTVWLHGVASSTSPIGTWRSVIGAVSRFDESNLQVIGTPTALAGPPGGPFSGESFTFTLTNAGNTTANWRVNSAPTWLTPGATSGFLTPGALQDVTFVLNGSAYAMAPGFYSSSVTFENCTGNGATPYPVKLGIAAPVACAFPATDLRASASPTAVSAPSPEVGVFITAIGDIDVCAVGVDHGAPSVAEDLTVEIYEADGNLRGTLIASTTTATLATGMTEHVVPITAQLAACQDYEIVITRSSSGAWNEWSGYALPYDIGAAIRVRNGCKGGIVSSTLPGVSVYGDCSGCDAPGGVPFDIGKLSGPVPPPSTGGPGALASGAYVVIGAVSQVYGVGVRADVPSGQPITVSIYDASSGGRGALLAQGNANSLQGGTRWHDVPVAFTSAIGDQYEIEVACPVVTAYGYWDDTTGLPYTPYGAITVTDGVVGGSPDQTDLIHMRVHMCDEVLTAVGDTPVRVPMRLASPVPNPTSGSVILGYEVAEATQADMAIYDAKGRKVAEVFAARQLKAGPGRATFDTGRLAAGVYFVRMQTASATMTAKLVVVR